MPRIKAMANLDELKASDTFMMHWATEKEFSKFAKKNYSEEYLLQAFKEKLDLVEKVVGGISSEATNLQTIASVAKKR